MYQACEATSNDSRELLDKEKVEKDSPTTADDVCCSSNLLLARASARIVLKVQIDGRSETFA